MQSVGFYCCWLSFYALLAVGGLFSVNENCKKVASCQTVATKLSLIQLPPHFTLAKSALHLFYTIPKTENKLCTRNQSMALGHKVGVLTAKILNLEPVCP